MHTDASIVTQIDRTNRYTLQLAVNQCIFLTILSNDYSRILHQCCQKWDNTQRFAAEISANKIIKERKQIVGVGYISQVGRFRDRRD